MEKNKSVAKEVRLASKENTNTLDSIEKKNKKSVSATVSNTYIPNDIAFSILSKLPLKSFKRFECVCKPWSLLFENTRFMNMFHNNFLSSNSHSDDGSSLLLKVMTWPHYQQLQVLYTLSGDRFQNMVKLDFSNPFDDKTYIDLFGFGSINGIILLHQYCGYKHVLWNPATQKFKLLPPSLVDSYVPDDVKRSFTFVSYLHGFGYDFVTDDYKVIRYLFFPDHENMHRRCLGNKYFGPLWEIYSRQSNSWRKLDVDMPPSLDITEGTHVYMDGVFHWLCQNDYGYWKKHNIPFQPCLVSFYLSNEVFFITPIPTDVDDCFDVGAKWKWINLVVLNGSIALISYHEKMATFHVSILGEVGMKESWTRLFTVGPLPCVERSFGVGTKGQIFFTRKDKELAWFDLSTQMIEELGFKVDFPECRIIVYKESILPFGGLNN